MTDPTPDVPTLRRLLADAEDEVVRLCAPGEQWRMSIPANPGRDSDLMLMAALSPLPGILDRLEAAEGAVVRVEALADEWDACDEHGNPLREGSLGDAADELRAALAEVTP